MMIAEIPGPSITLPPAKADRAGEIARFLRLIHEPGEVFEVRAVECPARPGGDYRRTASGYYRCDDAGIERAVKDILRLDGQHKPPGVYATLNPIKTDLLAWANHRTEHQAKNTTADKHILRRRWLLIDIDPVRDAGVSATDVEHRAALERANLITDELAKRRWPTPIAMMSGNGAYLLYRIDLPNDEASRDLVQSVLKALDVRYSDDAVIIDTSTFNAARLAKIPGTTARKGDDLRGVEEVEDRPHRMARLLNVPDPVEVVSADLLGELADEHVEAQPIEPSATQGSQGNGQAASNHVERCKRYLDKTPDAISGQDGHGKTLRAACECVRFGLDDAQAMDVLRWWSQNKSGSEAWSDRELAHKLADARKKVPPSEVESRIKSGGYNPAPRNGCSDTFDTTPQGGRPEDWPDPQPMPDDLPPVAPFDYDLLPDQLRDWIHDIAERIQCPPDFPAVAAMIVLAGLIGRKVGIRPKRKDDWTVICNLWGAVIGRPSIMKTPAMSEPLGVLKRLEIQAKRDHERAIKEHEAARMVAEERGKATKKKVRDAIRNGGDAIAIAQGLADDDPTEPTRRRYLVNDSTVEKIGELLNENPNGLTCYRDELIGLLKALDKEGQEGARSFYLEAWNGTGRFTYDRIGRGTVEIGAAIVSIIGGIQPGPLGAYLRAAVEGGAGDDGLMQRFQLAVWPDPSPQWRNVDEWPDAQARQTAYAVYERIEAVTPASVGAECDRYDPDAIAFLRFTPDAQEVFNVWRANLERRLRSGDDPAVLEAHLGKYRSLIPSLALLVHLADVGHGPVGLVSLDRAVRWGAYLESHARRIFSATRSGEVLGAKTILAKIESGDLPDGFTLKDAYRRHWKGLANRDEAAAAVAVLDDLDRLRIVKELPGPQGGHPRTGHWMNPKNADTP